MNGGTGGRAKTDDRVPLAGKTGTTDRMVHTWMTGFSSKVSTATWVGNVSGTQNVTGISVNGTPGGVIRHEIWRTIMTLANELYPGEAFAPAPGLYLGASSVTMPDINALPPDVAQQVLRDAGLSAVISDVTVVSQNPIGTAAYGTYPAGTSVPFGSLVTISISRGGTVTVPDVSGLSVAEAKAVLLASGFSAVTEPQPSQSQFFVRSQTIPAGKVVGTKPSVGSSAEVLGAILLVISKGP
jgi:beta-lactam-binding protein with PASTA domain